ncbi:hypothetical protein [Embleya sp. NBC_00896]|uniref:hypothetical protein n=1 Tax=Embleya sp. NBC_00896 TaxID=2975961 RepID=UPI002F9114F1|nr:hypothetical protein OG928_44715 [Embleya sp. NBC_00896]
MGSRALWNETYEMLLPQARRPMLETDEEFRTAVLHAWLRVCEDTTEEPLDMMVTVDQMAVIRGLSGACSLGWRDALLGRVLAEHGFEPYGHHGGHGGLWGPPQDGKAFRPTRKAAISPEPLREVLRSKWNDFRDDVDAIRRAHAALEAVPVEGLSASDRVRAVVTRLCHDAWDAQVKARFCTWDDAEWWDYLDVEAALPWVAVALGLPGEHPEKYGRLVESVAWKTVSYSDAIEARSWDVLPSIFVTELADACIGLAREESPAWPPAAPPST